MHPDFLLEFLTFSDCKIQSQGLFVQPLFPGFAPGVSRNALRKLRPNRVTAGFRDLREMQVYIGVVSFMKYIIHGIMWRE